MKSDATANYSNRVIHGEYYPHIDGIRALAVLPVVLFHILAALCPGGFVGVDVFFVISGYLITGGILRDLKKDRFTVRNFYNRRIRRIMPAYFALIAGVFAAGCALYYSRPLIFLGDAVTAGTLFVANLHFWMMGGDYFAPTLHTQALLHLWSLSVEEQFYLFIPILCALLWKARRSLVAPALACLAALSLAGAVVTVLRGHSNDAFYFLHFRAWELLAGSLLALLPARPLAPGQGGKLAAVFEARPALLASLGLLSVALANICLSSQTPFPGLAALPPVLGTALLIRYGQCGWVSRLLTSRPLVATGKISYSLYLWHWPVTVFWKYATYDQLYAYDYVGMFLLSLLLAYLSWKYVELPVRTSATWTQRHSFTFAAAGISFLVLLGSVCVYQKGWPAVLHREANEVAYMPEPRSPFLVARALAVARRLGPAIGREFKFVKEHDARLAKQLAAYYVQPDADSSAIGAPGQPRIFLMGDSHAGAFRYGLDAMLRERRLAGYILSYSSTDMFNLELPEAQEALKKIAEMPQGSKVLLVEVWRRASDAQSKELMFSRLEQFAARIRSMGLQLYIATDNPNYPFAGYDFEARRVVCPPRSAALERACRQQSELEYGRVNGEINRRLAALCDKSGAVLVPLHLALKQGDGYTAVEVKDGKTVPLYRDTHHLSVEGSLRAAKFVMPYLFPEREPSKEAEAK